MMEGTNADYVDSIIPGVKHAEGIFWKYTSTLVVTAATFATLDFTTKACWSPMWKITMPMKPTLNDPPYWLVEQLCIMCN